MRVSVGSFQHCRGEKLTQVCISLEMAERQTRLGLGQGLNLGRPKGFVERDIGDLCRYKIIEKTIIITYTPLG